MRVHYEPFSAAVRDDPYPHHAALRERAPLHFAEEADAWCVARYDDVRAVLRDAERFSSDAMRSFLMGARAAPARPAAPRAGSATRDERVEYIDSFLVRGPRTLALRRAA